MSKRQPKENPANQYDKIFRENMEAALPGLIEHLLGINIVHSEEIPDDIQHTKERKPDLLKKVTDSSGKVFILHIEYQVQNENEMVFRMAEYMVMLLRKYALPVEQYVLFMGAGKARMPTAIDETRLKYDYQLVSLSEIDYKILLKSEKPEEKMLAILANFEHDGEDLALRNIVKGVQAGATGDFAESRYFEQLRILAQIGKLDNKFKEVMESITKFFKKEKDPFFQEGEAIGEARGEARGEERGKVEGRKENAIAVAIEMKKDGIPVEQIAKFTKLSIEEIAGL